MPVSDVACAFTFERAADERLRGGNYGIEGSAAGIPPLHRPAERSQYEHLGDPRIGVGPQLAGTGGFIEQLAPQRPVAVTDSIGAIPQGEWNLTLIADGSRRVVRDLQLVAEVRFSRRPRSCRWPTCRAVAPPAST